MTYFISLTIFFLLAYPAFALHPKNPKLESAYETVTSSPQPKTAMQPEAIAPRLGHTDQSEKIREGLQTDQCAPRAEYDEPNHLRAQEDQRLTEHRQCND